MYLPRGEPVAIDLGRLGPGRLTAWWFDPRYGHAHQIYRADASAFQAFTPPSTGRGQDWVLVLDQGEGALPAPGSMATTATQ